MLRFSARSLSIAGEPPMASPGPPMLTPANSLSYTLYGSHSEAIFCAGPAWMTYGLLFLIFEVMSPSPA